jgi:uncharacterized protein YabN with tetrapyrrole methylase and pyrophosphatase domain
LYTALFLALLAEREGWFSLTDLFVGVHAKMVRRHPHVFGDQRANTATQAYRQWQRIKKQERPKASRSSGCAPRLSHHGRRCEPTERRRPRWKRG